MSCRTCRGTGRLTVGAYRGEQLTCPTCRGRSARPRLTDDQLRQLTPDAVWLTLRTDPRRVADMLVDVAAELLDARTKEADDAR